ncbi:MAG: hypothetical protein L0Z50_26960, partial [Verrucomicrobiales bacterium]|nr:hypothetical protein [Verrucomicrobiales bacterium]
MVKSRVLPCAVGIALALLVLSPTRADEPRYFAIRNARIVTVSGQIIDNGTVVIANGLITAVGNEAVIPSEAWVLDGRGLTVYPGLIDALSTLGLPSPTPALGAPGAAPPQRFARGPEDRPASTPWVSAADEFRPDERRIETWRNSGFT